MPPIVEPPPRAQTLLSWREESRLLRWLGIDRARTLLDLGCGPGYVIAALIRDFPSLHVVGLDSDHDLVRLAQDETRAAGRATFVTAAAEAAPVAEGSMDCVLARYLFQHLSDPLAVAGEAKRVLRPGGRLAVVDIDAAVWGMAEPALPEVMPVSATTGHEQAGQGGRLIGRRLYRILCAAGFNDVHVDAFVYHSDALGLAPFEPNVNPDRLLPFVRRGVITDAELDNVRRAHARFMEAPDAYVMMIGLIASGTKPA